jgi:hypothetical protein
MLRDGVPVSLTYIDISPAGSVFEGVIGASLSYEENTVFDYEDKAIAKVTKNSNNMIEANSLSSSEFTTDSSAFEIQPNGKDLFIGAYVIIPGSIKLSVDGKEIKVIDGTVEFDAANSGDEAKLTKDSKLQYTISLETPLTKDQVENIGNVVKLNYQIKEYNVQRLELTNLLVHENAYVELNGKEVSLAKAMYRANYAIAETNDRSEVVYINAFYKDLTCTVDSISGNKINVTAVKNGYPAFKETLVLDAGCIFTDSTGNAIFASDIKVNDRVLVTTSPDLQYNVVTVIKVQ